MVSMTTDRPSALSAEAIAWEGLFRSSRCSSGKTVTLTGAMTGLKRNTVLWASPAQ